MARASDSGTLLCYSCRGISVSNAKGALPTKIHTHGPFDPHPIPSRSSLDTLTDHHRVYINILSTTFDPAPSIPPSTPSVFTGILPDLSEPSEQALTLYH
jgi:hypothetical protein